MNGDKDAIENREKQSGSLFKHCDREKCWETGETSNCDSNVESGKVEEEIKLIYKPPEHYKITMSPMILNDAWVTNLRRKE